MEPEQGGSGVVSPAEEVSGASTRGPPADRQPGAAGTAAAARGRRNGMTSRDALYRRQTHRHTDTQIMDMDVYCRTKL